MFGFLGRLLDTPGALEKSIEVVGNGLDKLYYSEEEKAEDKAEGLRQMRNSLLEWLKTTKGQNLARRIIALSITFVWLVTYCTSVAFNMAAVFAGNPENMLAAAQVAKEAANDMSGPIMLILGFYFAAPHAGEWVKVAMARFGKSTSSDVRSQGAQ